MLLFKILQEFLLPSVFTLVLLVVGSVLLLKSKKIGKIFLVSGIAFYYLFSITPVSDLLIKPLENKYSQLKKEELQKANIAVLLLGGRETDNLRSNEILRIYNNQKLQIIISGTDPLRPEIKEAEKVKEFLVERGILPENIILEDKSRNTRENAKNVKEIIGKEPFFLVTSASHMPRAIETFKKAGTNPIPSPADFKIIENYKYKIFDFFPGPGNLRNSSLALYEYFGLVFYRFSK